MKKEGILSVLLVIAVIFGVVSYSNNQDSQAEIARLEKNFVEEIAQAKSEGYEVGYAEGYDNGLEEGWQSCEHGWPRIIGGCPICDAITTVDGETLTGDAKRYYMSGYNDGYDVGYEERYESAQKYSGYELGYEDGYNDGYEWGRESICDEYGHPEDIYARGYDEGYGEGYNDGYEDGKDSDY